jgi:hypothetical protein
LQQQALVVMGPGVRLDDMRSALPKAFRSLKVGAVVAPATAVNFAVMLAVSNGWFHGAQATK